MSKSDILMDEDRKDIDMRSMDYHLADKDDQEVIEKKLETESRYSYQKLKNVNG